MEGFDLSTIQGCYAGSTPATAIYIGSTQIWSAGEPGYENEYLTFTALEDNCEIYYKQNLTNLPVEYSTDKTTWTTSSYSSNFLMATINTGDHLYIRGNNDHYATNWPDSLANRFYGSKRHDISGNLMSLTYGDNFNAHSELASTSSYLYCQLFENDTNLVNAENLKLTPSILYNGTYQEMFKGCTSLATIPELPATTLGTACYWAMFDGCTSLPSDLHCYLPATTVGNASYCVMFGRTSIVDARNIILPATSLYSGTGFGSYRYMFQQCLSLKYGPKLNAPSIPSYAYEHMFEGASSLEYIECLATTINSNACQYWTSGVASSGTFVKHVDASWSTGVNGIPSNWDIIEVDPEDDTWINWNNPADPDAPGQGTYYDDEDVAAQAIGYEDAVDANDSGASLYTHEYNDKTYYLYESPYEEPEEPEEEPEE